MTSELLVGATGILLSLLFSYIPGLNTWYAAKTEEFKKLFMLGALLITTLGVFGLGCAGVLTQLTGVIVTCTWASALDLLQLFVIAAIANQTAFKFTLKTRPVKVATAISDDLAAQALVKYPGVNDEIMGRG
jgi:hypothetical protein